MEFLIKYLYLWGSIIGFLIFLFIYFKREDLRTRMITAGIAVGIIGIFSEYVFFQDYWNPPYFLDLKTLAGLKIFYLV